MNTLYEYGENFIIRCTMNRNMSKTMMWFGWLAVNAAAVILGCVYWKHLLVG